MQRDNYRRTNLSGRFSPRPQGLDLVRRFSLEAGLDYFTTADAGLLETRNRTLDFATEFENSDTLEFNVTNTFEFLQEAFEISDGVILPIGGYGFTTGSVAYTLGGQRTASGTIAVTAGSFWSGDIKTLEYRQGRINILDQFSIEPTVSVNDVDLPEGSFTTTLVSSRFNYAFNPRMFFGAFVQYNSSENVWSNNLRLRWEYSPGSELFVVYTEDRTLETLGPSRFSELRNRGFVVKINRLFRL